MQSHDPTAAEARERELLFALDLFRAMPPRLCEMLFRFRRYTTPAQREVFVRQGEYSEDFHYVLSGSVSAYRTNSDGRTELLESLGPHDWFGEVSALSNQPSLATLTADMPCTLLTIDGGTFRILYKDPTNTEFRQKVDERYRARSLSAHLRTIPSFKGLSQAALDRVRSYVRFANLAKGAVIAEQDARIDSIYMVRSGAVSCVRRYSDGRQKILGYFMNNSSFGERALARDDASWPGTYTTLAPTDLLIVDQSVFSAEFGFEDDALEALRAAAVAMAREDNAGAAADSDSGSKFGVDADRLEVMVRRQAVKGGEALVIDLERCVRCNMCVETCVAVHEDRVPRLSKKGHRVSVELTLTTSCYNCEIPECMMSCSYGAIRRDVEGVIRFVYDNCVGCASCVSACPYGVIRYTPPPGADPVVPKENFLAQIPWLGRLFRDAPCAAPEASAHQPALSARGEKVNGKAIKCDLCAGLPFEGCIYNCPTSAISRENPAELFANLARHARVVDGSITDALEGSKRG